MVVDVRAEPFAPSPGTWFDESRHCATLQAIVADVEDAFQSVAPADAAGPVPSGFATCVVSGRDVITRHPRYSYDCLSERFATGRHAELAHARLVEAWGRCLSTRWTREPTGAAWKRASSMKGHFHFCRLEVLADARVSLSCGYASPD